jgi:hypothetical protein
VQSSGQVCPEDFFWEEETQDIAMNLFQGMKDGLKT